MTSDAQRKANKKYQAKREFIQILFLMDSDRDKTIYDHIKSQESIHEYIKDLVESDMQ